MGLIMLAVSAVVVFYGCMWMLRIAVKIGDWMWRRILS